MGGERNEETEKDLGHRKENRKLKRKWIRRKCFFLLFSSPSPLWHLLDSKKLINSNRTRRFLLVISENFSRFSGLGVIGLIKIKWLLENRDISRHTNTWSEYIRKRSNYFFPANSSRFAVSRLAEKLTFETTRTSSSSPTSTHLYFLVFDFPAKTVVRGRQIRRSME